MNYSVPSVLLDQKSVPKYSPLRIVVFSSDVLAVLLFVLRDVVLIAFHGIENSDGRVAHLSHPSLDQLLGRDGAMSAGGMDLLH